MVISAGSTPHLRASWVHGHAVRIYPLAPMSPARILSCRLLPLFPLVFAPSLYGQGVSLGGSGYYTQNFDTLPATTGTFWVNDSTLPGWSAQTDVTPNPLPIGIYNGGAAAASGFLSMGLAADPDRAIGFRPTTTNFGMTLLGLTVRNTATNAITIGHVEFNGELWRTQDTANNIDGYQVFYQIGDFAPANLGPFTVNNGGTYAVNAAVEDAGWIRIPALEYSQANAVAGSALVPALSRNISLNFMGVTLQPGQFLTFRWRNPNDTAGDAVMGIDDFSFGYSQPGASLVYNPAHGLGGEPNGVLTPSAAAYWLNGGAPAGFAHGDAVTFAANVTATINVPANAMPSTVTVSSESGAYTIGGAGRIDGALVKSGSGGLVLTSANAFSAITLNDGGTIVAQGAGALNANTLSLGNGGTLQIDVDSTVFGPVTGAGPLTKTGPGLLRLGGGTAANSFSGDLVVAAGTLEAGKTAGTIAVPGNLVIGPGAAFRYAGNAAGNQIADAASITINGGSFGDPVLAIPTNPGAPETVLNVTLNGGDFNTGRASFTTSNEFIVTAGTTRISRGGALIVGNRLTVGGTMELDGGSTTVGQESRVVAGAGGLVLNGAVINLNSGPSTLTAASQGSAIVLGGDVVSTGNSTISRFNAATVLLKGDLDLQGFNRTFDVTGSLTIGSAQATVVIVNGGIVKIGPGVLRLGGTQTYPQGTIVNGGKFLIDGSLASTLVTVGTGGTFGGTGTTSGTLLVNHGGKLEPGLFDVGTLTLANVTFGSAAGDAAAISVAVQPTPALVVTASNGLVANGGAASVSINVKGSIPALGIYPMIDYEGALGGAGFGAFVLGTLPNRVVATLTHDLGTTSISLDVTAVDQPLWSGAASSEWSTAALAAPKNWILQNAGTNTDFLTGDYVVFGDGANPLVNVSVEDVAPALIRFTAATDDYTLTGSKGIIGEGSLVKEGAAALTIANVNSFSGSVVINGGRIKTASLTDSGIPGTLGAGSTIILDGGVLDITGATAATNRALSAGTGGGGLIVAGQVTLSGGVSGTGTLTKTGPGRVVLSGNNGFNGRLVVSEGKLRYTGGTIGGASVTIALDGGELENDDVVETIFNDAGAILRTLEVGANGGTLNVLNATGAIAFQRFGGVTGSGTLRKIGPGIVRVQASNGGLAGSWILDQGTLEAGAADALGLGNVTVNAGLLATRNVYVATPIVMNGGALGTRSGDLGEFAGSVAINGPADVLLRSYTTPAQSRTLTISGLLSGTADLRVEGNLPPTGNALIVTNPANSYSGAFRVAEGQFLTSRPLGSGNPLGTASVVLTNGGLNLMDDGLGDNGVIMYPNPVTIAGTGTSQISVNRGTGISVGNTLQLGSLSIGAQTLSVTGANQYSLAFGGTTTLTAQPTFEPTTADLHFLGDISGDYGFTKTGAGRLVIGGLTSFTGAVNVAAGTLVVNGTTSPTADVLVAGGVFSGAGVVGADLEFGGPSTFLPGDALRGLLQIDSNLTLDAGSTVLFDLAHGLGVEPIAGNDYAQVRVGVGNTGAVTLNNAPLSLTLAGGIQENDLFFLVLNDGLDPVAGTFAGLSQDTVFVVAGQNFRISYTASEEGKSLLGGNDIALQAVPEPGSALLLFGGFALCAASGRRRALRAE
jgi:fibronectin-binding autotransporter adhesin